MAFVDEVTIRAKAGKGGDGVVRWLRTKGKEKGGPAGGDGGRGGNVLLEGVNDMAQLARYRYEKDFTAENGDAGGNENRSGKDGEPLILKVPVGTSAHILGTDAVFLVEKAGEQLMVLKGGSGGRGNASFKGSTNQNPFNATPGKEGEGGDILFSLKLIADAGLIGLPNAGKSSLLNALTRARSKVGSYAFTTLEPALGDLYGKILADIPGLIEGASVGRGLGIKFLKHIEKTRMLIHLVSAEQDDPLASYREVRKELEAFGEDLSRKPELILLSKIDLVSPEDCETKKKILRENTGREVLPISVSDPQVLKNLSDRLAELLA